jgi:hypothetical protein
MSIASTTCYCVYPVPKLVTKPSINSIVSMLWYPICTKSAPQQAPGMKKERRLTIYIDLSKLGLLALVQFVHYNAIEDCNESRRDPKSQAAAL